MFWYSYKGLQPHLQRAHAGHTQIVAADRQQPHNINPNRPALTRRQDINVRQRNQQRPMKTSDYRYTAWIALLLMIIGIISPFLLCIFTTEDNAILFGVACEILGLVLGIMSWSHRLGKVSSTICFIYLLIFGYAYINFRKMRDKIFERGRQPKVEYRMPNRLCRPAEARQSQPQSPQPDPEAGHQR